MIAEQTRKISEVIIETIEHLRIADDLVVVKLTTKVNKRKPVDTYEVVDGLKWDDKLSSALQRKRPLVNLIEELKSKQQLVALPDDFVKEWITDFNVGGFYNMMEEMAKKKYSAGDKIFHAVANDNLDSIYRMRIDSFDIESHDGSPVPTWKKVEFINNADYHLRPLVKYLRKIGSVIMLGSGDVDKMYPEIKEIPHYNQEEGKKYEIHLFWKPTEDQLTDIMNMDKYPHYPTLIEKFGVADLKKFKLSEREREQRDLSISLGF